MTSVRAEARSFEVVEPQVEKKNVYAAWLLSQYISRPAVAGAFSVAMLASGWMATARAAESLPGDTLYSVKILTERAKLSFASSDRKAVLHTEFAGRRLEEAARLQLATDRTQANPLVTSTLEAYEMELAYAGEELLSGSASLSTVTSVQKSLNNVGSALETTLAQTDDEAQSSQVLAAKEATKEASRVATSVAVDMHDKAPSEQSSIAIKNSFKDKLGDLEARQQFDLQRITVIETALGDLSPEVTAEHDILATADLAADAYTIESTEGMITEAMNGFAAGGYKTAFEDLNEVDEALLDIESKLAQIEIAIMQLSVVPEPTAEPEGELQTPQSTPPVTPATKNDSL